MAYNLGALVTSMVVQGRQAFERDVDAAGKALEKTARKGDDLAAGLDKANTSRRGLTTGLGETVGETMRMSDAAQSAATTIGGVFLAGSLAIGALAGVAVAKYAEYDAAISRAVAATGAYGDELEEIRDLTVDLGGSTVFTAREAAEGVTELGKAGLSTADILGGALEGSLDLAAAGEIAVADAAEIAATTLIQFRLRGEDATHVADLLAAGAGKAQGGVSELSQALSQSGLVASQFGLSAEETIGTLSAFASAGLLGSDAGTSFRTMLLNLATPTVQQTELMKQWNIQAYDQAGNFVGLTELAAQLQEGFAGATQAQRDQALGVIFGSDAIRAANVLYQQGADGIQDWIGAVDDAGYAARIAAENQNNLRGDLEKLGGAWDSMMINFGAGANGPLREVVQVITNIVDSIGNMPPEMQGAIMLAGALVAGIGLIAGAALLAVPQIVAFRTAIATLRAEMPLASAAAGRFATFLGGPWGVAIAGAILGGQLLTNWLKTFEADSEEITASLKGSADAVDVLSTSMRDAIGGERFADNWIEQLDQALIESEEVAKNWFATYSDLNGNVIAELGRVGDEIGALASSDLPGAQRAFQLFADETDGTRDRLVQLLNAMPAYRDELIRQAKETGAYADSMSDAEKEAVLLDMAVEQNTETVENSAQAYVGAREEVQGLENDLEALLQMLTESNDAGQNAITTNIDYQQALGDVNERIAEINAGTEGYARTLDTSTQAGRDNMSALVDLASAAWDAADAQLAVDGNTENFTDTLGSARDELIRTAEAMGYDRDQAEALADSILRIPTQREIEIIAETQAAMNAVNGFLNINGRRVTIYVDARAGTSYGVEGLTGRRFFADGAVRTKHMADGGVQRMSQQEPQMRAGGSWVVWAEDETEGESFIPHALSKRPQAIEQWKETGEILGVMPRADGLVSRGSGSVPGMGRSTVVNIMYPQVVDFTQAARDAHDIIEAGQNV